MIRTENQVELNFLCCGNCGADIIKVGDNLEVFIPSIHYKCLNCGSTGIFEKIVAGTTKKESKSEKVKKKKGS